MYQYTLLLVAIVTFAIFKFFQYGGCKKLCSSGKSVVVTGCDSGIGLSLAITAHKLGFHVFATCLDNNGYGANYMRENFPDIVVVPMDVTNPADIQNTLKVVKDHLEKTKTILWALINNAGVLVYGHFDWQLDYQAESQVQVNFLGVLRVTKAFLPLIRQAKGRVINITSANGNWCLPGLSVYCGTKHALDGFSNSLRMEMRPWNVKVILINPGNLPGSTRILAAQSKHAKAMQENFSEEDNQAYGEYFDLFQKHLQTNFCATNLNQDQPLNDLKLNKMLESSLLMESPRPFYSNINFGFRMFMLVTKLVPTYYGDRMILQMWGDHVGYNLDRDLSM
ncbi:D-beta-hydroxybutyrate dehydrogenase, mitochondrial-like [Daphnia pulicaria]|uniref:D-beta-hydroxybutyrate dehydrogenase, mitochondrial-like n=1 Tax=Daphnia pulicaria TaxID=35523 RepID=UPI001EECE001|nr:D-beta-hydroxybutyrate dehydrogenase, mitochondrial-like [Daphnia pulicaria]